MDTKKLRQKILDLAIRGKLVPQDPNDEHASVLLERIRAEKERLIAEGKIKRPKKSKASSSESHYQNLPYESPDNWGWCRIDDIAFVTKLAGFEYSKYIADNLSTISGIPLFKGKNIKNGSVEYVFESYIPESISDELWRSQITKKCLLTPYVGAIGNVGIHSSEGKFHLGSNVGKIEISNDKENIYLEEFLRYYLMSSYGYAELTKHKKATAQESISIEAIRDVVIPVVSIEEQKRIVSEIEDWQCLFDKIDQQTNNIYVLINRSKSKILELAMQGKLVAQDPTDEPAAEMLRRVNPKAKIITDNPHSRNIPIGWCLSTVKDLCVFLSRGKSPKYAESANQYPVFAQKCNLKDGGISLDQARFLDETTLDKWLEKYHLRSGDVLINSTGTGTVGRTRLFCESVLGDYSFTVPDSHVSVVRSYDEINSSYLFYYLFSSPIQEYFEDNLAGSTNQKELYIDVIGNAEVLLPPVNEQKRIVAKIEELYGVLDEIEASLQS